MKNIYKFETIPNTSEEFTEIISKSLIVFFFQNLFANKKNIDFLLDEKNKTNELMKKIFLLSMDNLYTNLIGKNSIFYKEYVLPEQNKIGREFTHEEIASLFEFYFTPQNRFASMYYEVFTNHELLFQNIVNYINQFENKNIREDENKLKITLKDKDNYPFEYTPIAFKLLIASLPIDIYNPNYKKTDNQNEIILKLNNLGLPQLIDFNKTLNMLINELNDIVSGYKNSVYIDAFTQLLQKLDNKYKNKATGKYKDDFVWIERLKKRLKAGKYQENMNLTTGDIQAMISFESGLTKSKIIINKFIKDKEKIYNFDFSLINKRKLIKFNWLNEIYKDIKPLSTKSKNNLLGVDEKGMIVIDKNSYQYVGNPNDKYQAFVLTYNPNFEQKLNILALLGIKFTASTAELRPYANLINDSYIAIIEELQTSNNPIKFLNEIYSSNRVSSRLNKLIEIEITLSAETEVLMHTTPNGESHYSITCPSAITYILSSLNSSATIYDFVKSNPQFGRVNADGTVEVFPYQAGSEILKLGGLVFDSKGNRKGQIEYNLITGVTNVNSDGKSTDVLEYPDRVAQEIHYLLKNVHYTIINSDKSNEFGIGLNNSFVTARTLNLLMDETTTVADEKVLSIYRNYLLDEVNAAIREIELPSNIKYYSKEVVKLGHFNEILGEKLVKQFTDRVINKSAKKKMTADEFVNQAEVDIAITKYLQGLTIETLEGLVNLDLLQKVEAGKNQAGKVIYRYNTNAISHDLLNNVIGITDANNIIEYDAEKLAAYLAINKQIGVIEQHKMFYGHPALYKDLAKRANGLNSTKDAIVDNPTVIKWMDERMKRFDGKIRSKDDIQTYNNVVIKDVTAVAKTYKDIAEGMYESLKKDLSKEEAEKNIGVKFDSKGKFKNFILDGKKFTGQIKAYVELNEADGQGWIMPDMFRDIIFLSSKFSKQQERQWAYEMAYEVVARNNKSKNDVSYRNVTEEELSRSKEILIQGNPGVILQVLKHQYFGYAANNSIMQTVFLKHSVQPKFFRHVEGTQFEKMYLTAQKNQIDIIGFESGEKVGAMINSKGEFSSFYNDEGEINLKDDLSSNEGMSMQTLYTRYLSLK